MISYIIRYIFHYRFHYENVDDGAESMHLYDILFQESLANVPFYPCLKLF